MSKWPMVPLSELLTPRNTDVEVCSDGEYHFAGIFCFGGGAFVGQKKSGLEFAYKRLTRLHKHDFTYPKLMAWEGAFAVVPAECEDLVVSTEFPVFTIDKSKAVPEFIGYYFKRASVWPEVAGNSTGTNVRRRRLHPSNLLKHQLPLPPLKEQQRLVEYLDALSAKVDEAKRLRMEADNQAAALEASWANAFFNDAHAAWPIRPLGELSEIGAGVTLGRSLTGPTIRRPYLRVANVQDGRLDLTVIKEVEIRSDELEKWNLVAGDVLLTEGGDRDKLGRGTVWQGEIPECIHQNHIFRVRVDSSVLIPEFLSVQTASPYGREYFQSASKQTTNLASINQRQLKAFPVIIPPREEQQVMLRDVNKLRGSLNASQDVRNEIRKELAAMIPAILDQAFNGEVS